MTFGENISPILSEIEGGILEEAATLGRQPKYTDDGFRAACSIFMSALMDKMWDLQESEGIEMVDRGEMAVKCGESVRTLVKIYTNIDTHKMFSNG